MFNKVKRGRGMKPQLRTIKEEDLNKFLEKDGLLFTSKDLAKMLGVTEGALRKQRSKNRSIFKFSKLHTFIKKLKILKIGKMLADLSKMYFNFNI